jgi:hypothetical protein
MKNNNNLKAILNLIIFFFMISIFYTFFHKTELTLFSNSFDLFFYVLFLVFSLYSFITFIKKSKEKKVLFVMINMIYVTVLIPYLLFVYFNITLIISDIS